MVKKKKSKSEQKEIAYGARLVLANKKNDYIKNLINGRYYLARVNMIAEQINLGIIKEKIDSCEKTIDLMKTEYALMKMQAIMSMRNAHFAKNDLIKDYNLTDNDLLEIEEDYYDGKVIREDYDEEYKKGNKAEFVKSSKKE